MFESLKKKLENWLGKEEKPKKKTTKSSKTKAKTSSKSKPKKAKAKTPKAEVPAPVEKVEDVEISKETEPKPSFFQKFKEIISSKEITKEDVEEIFQDLEIILLENNVSLEVVDKIKEDLIKSLTDSKVNKSKIEETIKEKLKESIENTLIEPFDLIEKIKSKPGIFTIVFFGINGSGKTTSLAKLAYKLKKAGISSVLAAGDTFRAASIEQLQTHADKLDIPLIRHNYGSDPAAVGFDAIKYAEKNHLKCVLIDTAGRMYTKDNLIKEMEKVIRVIKPDLKIFVGESITGNDATEQARVFNEAIGIDGIVLTKADVDDKGGTALSVSYITKKPILFLGEGQTYDDLKPFSKKTILKNLGLD